MERDKLEQKLWDIRISRDKVEILEILAEFDRLTTENEKLSTKVAELDGREFDADEVDQCNDCGEWIKPPPCPECQGTKYINRVVSVTDWEWHRYYMIVDCLNCSGAKG